MLANLCLNVNFQINVLQEDFMAITAFIFLTVFISIYLEVLTGSMGIIVPLTGAAVFYLAIAYGWRTGLVISLVAGSAIDMLYGRALLITPYCMMLTVFASLLWLHKGDPVSALPNLIPGALTAFIVTFPWLALNTYFNHNYLQNLYLLIFSVLCGALMLPILIPIFDYIAEKQGLPLYRKAKAQAMDRK